LTNEFGYDGMLQNRKYIVVAEEGSLIDRHCLDNFLEYCLLPYSLQVENQLFDGLEAVTPCHGEHPRLH
jgi:hypothetical protein